MGARNTLFLTAFAYLVFPCALVSAAQAPANDNCTSPTPLAGGILAYDSTQATDGSGLALDPLVCDFGPFGDEQIYQDVWFSFTPGFGGSFDIESINNGNFTFDSRLAVYAQAGCPDDPANIVACDDDSGPFFEAAILGLPLVAGTPYLIRAGSFSPFTTEQPAAISLTSSSPPSMPPANDDCVGAISAAVGLTAFDSSNATDGSGLPLNPLICDMGPFGDDQIYQDVWFTFSTASTASFDIASVSNGGLSFDSRLAIYGQSFCPDNPLNVVACDDDSGLGIQAAVTSVLLAGGQIYTIRVGSYDSATLEEPAFLSIMPSATPPANDACSSATPLTAFGTYAFDNQSATTGGFSLAGFCNFGLGDDEVHKDIWFTYTPTNSGCVYISTLNQAGFDTKIAVYDSAACPADPATVLACSDEEVQPISAPFEAGLDVILTGGNPYLIRLGNYASNEAGGAGSLVIGAGPVAAFNLGPGQTQSGALGCSLSTFPESCNGDGGDQMGCSDCPCNNNAPQGTIGGCLNSAGTATHLVATGNPSVSLPSGDSSDLRFSAVGGPPGVLCILNSGDNLAPTNMSSPCFALMSGVQSISFDGLRCAVMNTRRHGGRPTDSAGTVGVTTNPWGGEGGPAAGIANAGLGFASGQTRFFQITHRDDVLLVCGRGLNTSQAIEVLFTP